MHRAVLLGDSMLIFKDALEAKGFFSIESAAGAADLSGAQLMIMDMSLKGLPGTLPKGTKNIPKIVVSFDKQTRLSSWLKVPFSYLIQSPTPEVLARFCQKIVREHSVVTENNQLRAENQIAHREIGLIDDINKLLATSRDINAILAFIARKIATIIKAEQWAAFNIHDEAVLTMDKMHSLTPKKNVILKMRTTEGIAGLVAEKGEPVLVESVPGNTAYASRIDGIGRTRVRSMMSGPLKSKARTAAVISLANPQDGEAFTEAQYTLFLRLLSHASVAVDQMALYKKLQELVVTDDLTSLFNSRYLNRSIEAEIMRSKRSSTSVSLVFMDVDHFKDINDNYGHLVGSKVLIEMGELLMDMLRTADIVARYGGDEFVIVLPQTTLHNAMIIAERIRKAIEQRIFMKSEGYTLRITASFGVASYPESSKSKEALLKLADEAMYSVKRRTRNGVYAII